MLQIKNGQRVTVWEPHEAERIKSTIEANISSAKKESEEEWKYYSWNAKFVGQAYGKAQGLEDRDRIELTEAAIENYYSKEKKKLYVTVVVFDFEKVEKQDETQE